QQHDRQKRADVQGRGGAIESDIARNGSGLCPRIQDVRFGHLMNEPALGKDVKEIRLIGAHWSVLGAALPAAWCNRSGVGFNKARAAASMAGLSGADSGCVFSPDRQTTNP